MNSAFIGKISSLTAVLVRLQKQADEVQAACQSTTFPGVTLPPAVRICASLMAREVRTALGGIEEGLRQLERDGSRAVVVRFVTPAGSKPVTPRNNVNSDDVIEALLASYEHSLSAKCTQLNVAFAMTDSVVDLYGRRLPQGGLHDK